MSVSTLERVLWRIRKSHPGAEFITNDMLARSIMYECGTDPKTIRNNRNALKKLGWIKTRNKSSVLLTDNDLTGDV